MEHMETAYGLSRRADALMEEALVLLERIQDLPLGVDKFHPYTAGFAGDLTGAGWTRGGDHRLRQQTESDHHAHARTGLSNQG